MHHPLCNHCYHYLSPDHENYFNFFVSVYLLQNHSTRLIVEECKKKLFPVTYFYWLHMTKFVLLTNFSSCKKMGISIKWPTPFWALLSSSSPNPCLSASEDCYPQSNESLLNLGMKCWNSGLSAGGSRTAVIGLKASQPGEKKKARWNSALTKFGANMNFSHLLSSVYFFFSLFF